MEAVLRRVQAKIKEKVSRIQKSGEFFQSKRRWEVRELRHELNSTEIPRQKSAVKRVIANMTLGRDVTALFVDVVKLGQTNNLELKKLVYLYILSNAKLQPEAALLAVNTFLMDSESPSPVVRALAIRTMMSIRVRDVMEYTVEALRRAITDADLYVRKTATLGLGKLFHHDRDMFFAQGFDKLLLSLLGDASAHVGANVAAVLMEMKDYGSFDLEQQREGVNWVTAMQLHLEEANEWGLIYVLELLADAKDVSEELAQFLVTRMLPQLSHSNPAVVMAAVKVIANFANRCSSQLQERVSSRVSTALLSLSKGPAETQYVVYKNIHALFVVFPNILRGNMDSFYVRFHDPPYIKREKLRLLLKLVTNTTADDLVNELLEYGSEVDMNFLEDVVAATASLAIKIQAVSERCATLMLKLLRRHRCLLSNVLIAAKNILRRYPNALILNTLIQHHEICFDEVADVEGRTALIWMLGEYCKHVKGGRDILLELVNNVLNYEHDVQLALVTAVVKIHARDEDNGSEAMLKTILEQMTRHSDDPDSRDRAVMYSRLISSGLNGEQTASIVISPSSAPINVDGAFSDVMTLKDLKKSINTSAAVLGRPYATFIRPYGGVAGAAADSEDEEEEDEPIDLQRGGQQSPSPTDIRSPTSSPSPRPVPSPTAASPLADELFTFPAPATEADFTLAWEKASGETAQRQLHGCDGVLAAADVKNVSKWMMENGFVVAAVVSSLRSIVYMASVPSLDKEALCQVVVEREASQPSMIIVKGTQSSQLVHVVCLQFEKILSDSAALAPPSESNGISLDDLFT